MDLKPEPENRTWLQFVIDHRFGLLLCLTFAMMPLVWAVEHLERAPDTARWAARHRGSLTILKQALCMLSIPGLAMLLVSRWRRR